MGMGGGGKAMSDINVTPLVDVMLVLLIIFMVSAPLLVLSLIHICEPTIMLIISYALFWRE